MELTMDCVRYYCTLYYYYTIYCVRYYYINYELAMDGQVIEQTENFSYLGCEIAQKCGKDCKNYINKSDHVFGVINRIFSIKHGKKQ